MDHIIQHQSEIQEGVKVLQNNAGSLHVEFAQSDLGDNESFLPIPYQWSN